MYTLTSNEKLTYLRGRLQSAARRFNTELPKAMTDEIAKLESATLKMPAPKAEVLEAVANNALAGRDPFAGKDGELHKTTLLLHLSQSYLYDHLDKVKNERIRAVVFEHVPAILKAWAPKVAEAGQTLKRSAKALPGVDFNNRQTATIGMTPNKLIPWAEAVEAMDDLQEVVNAWQAYGQITGRPNPQVLALAPLTLEQRQSLPRDPNPWRVALLDGVTLDLATSLDEYDRRAATIATAEAAARVEREKAEADAVGFGL